MVYYLSFERGIAALSAILIVVLWIIAAFVNMFMLIKHRRLIRITNILLGIAVFSIVAVNYYYIYGIVDSVIDAGIDEPDLLKFLLIPLFFVLLGSAVFQKRKRLFIYLIIHTIVLTLPIIAMDNNYFFDNIFTVFFLASPLVILVVGGVFLYDMIGLTIINTSNCKHISMQ